MAIAVLWFPLVAVGPAGVGRPEREPIARRKIGAIARPISISQATLGEIDPTSETIKLATLGMRGVAVQLLWNSAHQYQKKEDWTSLSAVLEQITACSRNFFSVWDFQAHNLSYNISVEFDDYRDRFSWVMKGIEFFKGGMQVQRHRSAVSGPHRLVLLQQNRPRRRARAVPAAVPQTAGRKGEKHTDNWLIAYDWYVEAQKLVDSGKPLRVYLEGQAAHSTKPGERAPSPLLFHSEPRWR